MNIHADPAPIGHNNPPQTIAERLLELRADLLAEVEQIAQRATHGPREIKTETDMDSCGTIVKEAGALFARIDTARTHEKEPYLKGGREVDAFFKTPLDRLTRIKSVFTEVATSYQRKLAAEARAKAEAEARKAREEEAKRIEAARKAQESERAGHAASHAQKAEAAAQAAEEAEARATAPMADAVAATVTDSGLIMKAKGEWKFNVKDFDAIDLNKLRPYFKRDAVDAAIKLAIKQGVRSLSGVEIYEDVKATFR